MGGIHASKQTLFLKIMSIFLGAKFIWVISELLEKSNNCNKVIIKCK